MRPLLLIILVSLSLGFAGCSKAPTPTPTTTNGTTTPPTGNVTTPTTPTSPTGGVVTPKVVKEGSADFSQNTPAAPLAAVAFTIDPGYAGILLNVTFACGSAAPACLAANSISVKAAGVTCSIPDGPVTAPIACAKSGTAAAGAGKVEFTGTGIITARYQVIED